MYTSYHRVPSGPALLVSMSSSTHSGSSASRFQSILDNALEDYTNQTGVDLTKNDFAELFKRCDSPDEVVSLLTDKAKKFKEHQDGNRKLINKITPVVQLVHLFDGVLRKTTDSDIVSRKAFKPFERPF